MHRHAVIDRCIRGVVVIASLSGCNQVFALDKTELVDGKEAARCPAPGMAPQFDTAPRPVVKRTIAYYGLDEARTIAVGLENLAVVQGPVDSADLTTVSLDPDPDHELTGIRLAPEGNQLFVLVVSKSTSVASVERYDRAGDSWQHATTVPIAVTKLDQLSAPTRQGTPRRIIHSKLVGFSPQLEELVEDASGGWSVVGAPYSANTFGVDSLQDPNLSPDGLHLVFRGYGFSGENGVYYADRPDVDSRFGMAARVVFLIGNGGIQYPFLDVDCARIYFYAVPGIYYISQ